METSRRILVIDDEPEVLAATSRILKNAGYEVLEARSGAEGLDVALREIPDLVILDVVLGDDDGIEVCQQLKAEPKLQNTYIALASGKRLSPDEVITGLKMGAVEYFRRPFHSEEFVARLRTLFRLQDAEAYLRESEEKHKTTLSSIGDAVISTSIEGLVVGMNPVAELLTGWKVSEAVGKPLVEVFQIIDESTRAPARNPADRVLREGIIVRLANHTLLLARDGREIPIADSAAPILNKDGDITGVVIVFRDQSHERASERALEASHEKLLDAQFLGGMGSFTWEIETGKVIWSEGMYHLLGYDPGDRIDISTINNIITHPDDLDRITEWLMQGIESTEVQLNTDEFRLIQKSGDYITVRVDARIKRENGKAKMLLGTCIDITELKRTESKLKEAEEELRAIVDSTPYPVAVVDPDDHNIHYWSQSAKTLFGHTAPTTPEWYDLAYPDPTYREDVIQRWKPMLQVAREKDQPVNAGEYEVTCADRSTRICELFAAFVHGKLVVTFRDLTTQREMEIARAKSEKRFRSLFIHAPMGIALVDELGRPVETNAVLQEILGVSEEELDGKPFTEFTYPDDIDKDWSRYQRLIKGEIDNYNIEKRYIRPGGEIVWAHLA